MLPGTQLRIAVSAALCGLTFFLGYWVDRSDFNTLFTAYVVFFGIYLYLICFERLSQADVRWYVGLGVLLRVLLLFSIPNFSDDVFRFIWDGRLLAQGIHPFAHIPDYFMGTGRQVPGLTTGLYNRLNSPEYFSVYPPVCQAVFGTAAWLFPVNERGAVFVMKLFLLGCELVTMRGLHKGGFCEAGKKAGLIYALNPLVILEVAGNCHFEGAMICFLVLGISALQRMQVGKAALWLALSTASKLVPLMFVPIVVGYLGWKQGFRFVVYLLVCLTVLFAPLFDRTVFLNIGSSLDLYFQQFQFNASIYYLLRMLANWVTYMEMGRLVGPLLGFAVVAGILALAWHTRRAGQEGSGGIDLRVAFLGASMLQMSGAAVVHPWYITLPFALGLGTRWQVPAIAWSGLAILSYSHYAGGRFQEHFGWIGLEYGILWVLIVLWSRKSG
jgi:hypothetical protein